MMKEESFLLVSLEESKAKQLAQVISNDTCRKILDFLSKGSATETEIAKAMELPLSTVHYNLKNLVDNKLVVAEEFHYSKKGKEVNHYSLANKIIIISPKKEQNIIDRLKSVFIVAGIGVGISAAMGIFSLSQKSFKTEMAQDVAMVSMKAMAYEAPKEPNIAMYFLAGTIIALILVALVEIIRSKTR